MYNTILDDFEDDSTRTRVSNRPFDTVVATEEPAREDGHSEEPDAVNTNVGRKAAKSDSATDEEMMPGMDDNESWSDDPVRMYLTQMGEIPLLTRQEEITLAKRIEDTRRKFRTRLLECDYVIQSAFKILKRVRKPSSSSKRTQRRRRRARFIHAFLRSDLGADLLTEVR